MKKVEAAFFVCEWFRIVICVLCDSGVPRSERFSHAEMSFVNHASGFEVNDVNKSEVNCYILSGNEMAMSPIVS